MIAGPWTLLACQQRCQDKAGCKMFAYAVDVAAPYAFRCDLFNQEITDFVTDFNFDFYISSPLCPAPLLTRELILKNWHCGDGGKL